MKKQDVMVGYQLINGAKLTKLEDEAKFKVIKVCKQMKPIVEDIQEFVKDAREKLKGENHEAMEALERKENKTDEELKTLNEYSQEYTGKVDKCVYDELNTEVELGYDKLTEDEVKKLVSSNDWNVAQTIAVMTLFE